MPVYQIRGRDGKIYQISGPAGATKEQVKNKIMERAPEAAVRPEKKSVIENIPGIGGVVGNIADYPAQLLEGVLSTGKSVADAFGARNPVSNALDSAADWMHGTRTAESREAQTARAVRSQMAAKKGVLAQVGAEATNILSAPIETTANAIGSAVPFIAAGLAAPATGGSSLAPIAAMAGLGAVAGAGTVKSAIYEGVRDYAYEAALKDGRSEKQAAAMADKLAETAQEYSGANLGHIALGAALGAAASSLGFTRQFASTIGRRAAARIAEAETRTIAATAPRSIARGTATGAVEEYIPEAIQGGQERYAKNAAMRREGSDVGEWEGVAGQAAAEGFASLVLGGYGGARGARFENRLNAGKELAEEIEALPSEVNDETRAAIVERFQQRGLSEEEATTIVALMERHKTELAAQEAAVRQAQEQATAARTTGVEPDPDPDITAPGAARPVETEITPPPLDPEEQAAQQAAYEQGPQEDTVDNPFAAQPVEANLAAYYEFASRGNRGPAPLLETLAGQMVDLTSTGGLEPIMASELGAVVQQFFTNEAETLNKVALERSPVANNKPTIDVSAPVDLTPERAMTLLQDEGQVAQFAAAKSIDIEEAYDILDSVVSGESTGLKYSRPAKDTVTPSLFKEELPTQAAGRLDKREELQQRQLEQSSEDRIAQQEELLQDTSERVVDAGQREVEQREETLGDIEFALQAQAPENAVYRVRYEPEDKNAPYKLVAERTLGEKNPEVVLRAVTLKDFSDQVYGQMGELTPYIPDTPTNIASFEVAEKMEPTIATSMVQRLTSEIRAAREALRIDNNQMAQLLNQLERPNAYKQDDKQRWRAVDAIAKNEEVARKAMEQYRNATGAAVPAAEIALAEANQRLAASVQNRLLNPIRARLKSMVEMRQDEKLGAKIRQRDAKAEIDAVKGPIEGRLEAQREFAKRPRAPVRYERVPGTQGEVTQDGLSLPDGRNPEGRAEVEPKATPAQRDPYKRRAVRGTEQTNEAVFGDYTKEERARLIAAETELRDAEIDEREAGVQKYSRSKKQGGTDADTVQKVTDAATAKWKGKPSVTVVQSVKDIKDRKVRAAIRRDGAEDAKGLVAPDGAIYLIADNIASESEAAATLFHEALGHTGLAKLFRDKLDSVLEALYKGNAKLRADADAWMEDNPGAYADDPNPRARAVEEVLAVRSEAGKLERNMLQRIAAVIRDFARRMGVNLKFSDGDVAAILAEAHERAVSDAEPQGAPGTVRYTTPEEKALADAEANMSDAMRRTVRSKSAEEMVAGMSDAIKARKLKPFVDALKEHGSALTPTATQAALFSMPTSGIIGWFGKDIPGLKEIDVLIHKMASMKARIIKNANPLAQRIDDYMTRDPEKRLADAQSIARISGIAPDEFSSMQDALQKHRAVKAISKALLDNANDRNVAKRLLKEIRSLTLQGKAFVAGKGDQRKWSPALEAKVAELKSNARNPDKVSNKVAQWVEINTRIKESYTAWERLGEVKGGQRIYKELRAFYKDMFEAELALLDGRIDKLTDEKVAKRIRDMRADMMRQALDPEAARKAGDVFWDLDDNLFEKDYFPFMREGKYWLRVKGAKDGSREPEFHTYVTALQRNRAQKVLAQRLKVSPNDNDVLAKGEDVAMLQESLKSEDVMMQRVFDLVGAAKRDVNAGKDLDLNDLVDGIYQTWLLSTPERSVRRRMMHAKEVTGFSSDVLNHYSRQVTAYANQLSKMAYAGDARRAVGEARDNVADRSTDDNARLNAVIDEFEKRAEAEINPPPQSAVVNALNRAAFYYYLTAGLSAAVQMLSVPVRVLPRFWRDYGYAQGTAMFVKYMAVWQTLGQAKVERVGTTLGDELHALMPNINSSKKVRNNPLLQRALKAGMERNILETVTDTLVQNEQEVAARHKTGVSRARHKTVEEAGKIMSVMFQGMENMSRQVTYFMSFELAYKDYAKKNPQADEKEVFDHAVNAAADTLRDTLGDYSNWERPRLGKQQSLRAVFLFKMYAIVQTKFLVGSFYDIYKGFLATALRRTGPMDMADKKEAAGALKELSGVVMMIGLLGGLKGMPLYTPFAWALAAAFNSFDDDDDKDVLAMIEQGVDPRVTEDNDIMFRMWLKEKLGSNWADVLSYGPASVLTGTDLSSRVSIDLKNMWFRESVSGDSTAETVLKTAIANIAPAQMGVSILDGVDAILDGELMDGAEKMIPAFFRAWVNTAQINEEGVVDRRGNTLMDKHEIGLLDKAKFLVGGRPLKLSEQQGYTAARAKGDKRVRAERRDILDDLYQRLTEGEISSGADIAAFYRDVVIPFNRRNPHVDLVITQDTMAKSIKRRNEARGRVVSGMQLTKKGGQRDYDYAREFVE